MADDLTGGLAGLIAPVIVGGALIKITDAVFTPRTRGRKPASRRTRSVKGLGRESLPSRGDFSNLGY
jgi:hypothetical protein